MEEKKLSVGVKIGYGVADFGGNLFFTATAFVLLNYLTDTVGLSAALAGIALMVGRIWDAFYDPVIGYISDRTKTKMGRRRPFMLGGSIPLFIAMIIMFTNPTLVIGAGISQTVLFVYTMVVYIILCTAYSTVNIPYSSLGPELTNDYNERTSLNGYRFGFAGIGTLLGAGLALPRVGAGPPRRSRTAASSRQLCRIKPSGDAAAARLATGYRVGCGTSAVLRPCGMASGAPVRRPCLAAHTGLRGGRGL